ncbi:MAG: CARDB domain-containing protein [Anaerolineae bacterium]
MQLTATPTLALPTATRVPPDLVVASIDGAQTLTLSGGSASATYTIVITNTGGSPTGSFNSTLTVQPGNTVTNLAAISSLNAGESITLPTPLTFTGAGTYTLTVRADSGSTVTESFEANNTNSLVVTVSN